MAALTSINLGVSAVRADGDYSITTKHGANPDVATLVADGANPTQAHVTQVNAGMTGDVVVLWNSTITKKKQLQAALRQALVAADSGYGGLT
jgi:hypothetical protein